jgi:hypothetical protein
MLGLLNRFYNFHWVVPKEAARAAQPWMGFYTAFLKGNGIKAIINLRGHRPQFGWWHVEARAAKETGAAHLEATLDSRHLPKREMLIDLIKAFDAAPRPFLLKCSGGQDRSSFAAALFILHRDGWTAFDTAQKQFSRFPYLHFPKRHQRWLKLFPAYARREANGRPLAQWLAESYSPEALQAWLNESGHSDTFAGVFVEPRASRWQR